MGICHFWKARQGGHQAAVSLWAPLCRLQLCTMPAMQHMHTADISGRRFMPAARSSAVDPSMADVQFEPAVETLLLASNVRSRFVRSTLAATPSSEYMKTHALTLLVWRAAWRVCLHAGPWAG